MSFMLTTDQMRARTKTVTRRLGWFDLVPGDVLQAVEKSRGLKKGEHPKKIGQIRVVSAEMRSLAELTGSYGDAEAAREGFPEMTGEEFTRMFCRHMRCAADDAVLRIEFEHIDPKDSAP